MSVNIIKKIAPVWVKKLLRQLIQNTPSSKKKKIIEKLKREENRKKTKTIINNIFGDQGLVVSNGPFQGMNYIDSSNGSQLLPKLVGSYEEPIHPWLYQIISNDDYSILIDVGCAEGYYAVGLALSKPNAKVFAYDIDVSALDNAKKLAEINGLSGLIRFSRSFDRDSLRDILISAPDEDVLVFMDVEGAELDLLSPDTIPEILECDILVELHDCFFPGLTEKIVDYLRQSHSLEIIFDYPWRKGEYSLNAASLSNEEIEFVFDERRPSAMRWLYGKKK